MSVAVNNNVDNHDDHHHHKETFITKWIFSTDHKMIAKQYFVTGVIVMGIIGVLMSLLFRIQLAWPEESFSVFSFFLGDRWAPDGVMDPNIYLALVTIHGTIMVFFVLTAGLSGTFSNLLIPLQIGARDMASGFLNMLAYWLFFISSAIMVASLFVEAGPAAAGWTIYPPLSALPQTQPGSGAGMTLWLVSMAFFIASSLLGSLNYIVTVLNLRTKGMTMFRLPLTIWAFFVTAIIGVISFPVLLSAALLLIMDRSFGTSFFLSDIFVQGEVLHYQGGSPVLFEHLFWFLGHPEVYIVLLPALGITSEVIATCSRKPIFGYKPMVYSISGIAGLGFIVWGHHMFVSGMNPMLGLTFMVATMMIALPSAVKVFNWLGTIWGGDIKFTTPMLFALSFVSMFVIGGLSGIFMAATPVDIFIHDTYFIVAHFHYVLFSGTAMAVFGSIYFWFPKMFGRKMNETAGKWHFFLTFMFLNGTFFLMHILGAVGFPRRLADPYHYATFKHLLPMNQFITYCAIGMVASQVIFAANFFYSIFKGPKVGRNPWNANGLEWMAPSPPGHGNFDFQPIVYRGPYEYNSPEVETDFYPQTQPPPDGVEPAADEAH